MSRKGKREEIGGIFSDLSFNIMIVIILNLALAMLLINPVARDATVKKEANFIITMEWPKTIDCDVDMWVRGPDKKIVYFGNKSNEYMHIERDDLGIRTDSWAKKGGGYVRTKENQEVWTLRSHVDGDYVVNSHLYSCRTGVTGEQELLKMGDNRDIPVKVEIIRINPHYNVEYTTELVLTKVWDEETAAIFTLEEDGKWFSSTEPSFTPLVRIKKQQVTHHSGRP